MDADHIASLKAELEAFLHEDPLNTERILSRIDQLAWSVGEGPFSGLMLLLGNLDLGEQEARTLWDDTCEHRARLEQALGRPVPFRVALFDLVITRNRGSSRARILDLVHHNRAGASEMIDPITGLHAAPFFDAQMPREIGRARRFNLPLSLVHAEIDDFAGIAERFGTAVGSVLLKEIAGVIRDCIRDMDYAARTSSAEFALLLTETDRLGAYYVADRLRQRVEAFYLERQIDGRPFECTISAGVASFPQDAESADDLRSRARRAFYNARIKGRGSVAIFHKERREYLRLEPANERLKVILVPEGESTPALADMKNISSGGVLFETDRPIPIGRTVQIQCQNLREGDEVLIPGRVVRIERFESDFGDRYEIGVLFDLVVEQQLEGVIGFLEKFIAQDDSPERPRPAVSDPSGAA